MISVRACQRPLAHARLCPLAAGRAAAGRPQALEGEPSILLGLLPLWLLREVERELYLVVVRRLPPMYLGMAWTAQRHQVCRIFNSDGLCGGVAVPGPKPAANGSAEADHRCDHCGQLGAAGPWDWPGRPDGIWLHSRCEAPWSDSGGQPVTADKGASQSS
jgi:hypothetical protein